ncbi:hypothetical protein AWC30_16125 [Mycolicibacillus trivialis]|uniref:Uncharacterized protein n=2 Tax=Mycolicibacillus trivialis TaxID=1798 RepID=A0A1X2EFN9_9MYCO|nr:hypothetical protein AWC30_16125 [Mycolicibacillus trivialis]
MLPRGEVLMDPELVAVIEEYLRAHGMNAPPPQVMSDLVSGVGSTIDGLLATLGMAANLGDPADDADAQLGQEERDAGLLDAQAKFSANETQSAQLMQALPQSAAGIAGAVGGVFSGLLQGFTQIPQQFAQGAQQALQAGLGAFQQSGAELIGDPVEDGAEEYTDAGPDDLFWDDDGLPISGDSGAGVVEESTAPTGYLGPPPTPSPGTAPASAQAVTPAPPAPPTAPPGPRNGLSALPFVPPGAMYGGHTDAEPKPDTKRVVAPSVKNGAPVQGRITVPPPPVTKLVAGKPVATRHVVAKAHSDAEDSER